MRIFTTGVSSGIGKYIYEHLGGDGLTRETPLKKVEKIKREGVDVIIHCAFNSKEVTSESIYSYFDDNLFLTKELFTFPYKKFIYFSTVDLYPKDENLHLEDEIINLDSITGIYGMTKLVSESIVKSCSNNYLILRSTSLLGQYMRKNTLMKMIMDEDCRVALSGSSTFNYVLYSNILDFIKLAIERDITGVYNIASLSNITLSKVADILEKKVDFGSYTYNAGNISNEKICRIFPTFKKTSINVLKEFIK